ncbi:MAG: fluoride efflux transporter CrcB [Dethiosulfovibrio sp.]|nr:fluoride efflux transporter CrcB [Dethiosulfovibrio sp.]
MSKIAFMMIAGALGALSRYCLSSFIQGKESGLFPWGTMTVNVAGCLLFGFIWALANERHFISGQTAFIVLTGFVGSFTTFSTMSFEAFHLISSAAHVTAIAYILGSQAIGVGAAFCGVLLGKLV